MRLSRRLAAGLLVLAGLLLPFVGPRPAPALAEDCPATQADPPWSQERVDKALAEGHPVLIVFTARWCQNCRFNEENYVFTAAVRAAVKQHGAVVLVADFSKSDPAVRAELKKYGRASVPLYVVLSPRPGRKPIVLPEVLNSTKQVVDALAASLAAPPPSYRVLPPDTTRGTIEGTVQLARAVPVPTLKRPESCAQERDISWTERPADLVTFDAERLTLAGCVVSLRQVGQGKDWPAGMRAERRTCTLMAHDGVLAPQVRWVRTGTGVAIANEMTRTNLDLKAYVSKTSRTSLAVLQFNVLVSPGTLLAPSDEMVLARPGLYTLACTCNCLRHMHAQILAFDHPYVDGPTRTDGRYVLDDVPPGDYEIVCWHGPFTVETRAEREGTLAYDYGPVVEVSQKVTVPAKERVLVDFVLEPPR